MNHITCVYAMLTHILQPCCSDGFEYMVEIATFLSMVILSLARNVSAQSQNSRGKTVPSRRGTGPSGRDGS